MIKYPAIDMSDIVTLYGAREGRHWFDPKTLKFFKTRLPRTGVATPWGNFFITSETNWSDVKKFTVRWQEPVSRNIKNIGDFHQHASRADAIGALRAHLNQLEEQSECQPQQR